MELSPESRAAATKPLLLSDLGHDAAVDGVQVGLRKDLIGQHLAPVAHEGDSRFITGRFDRKNNHIVSASLQNRVMSSASSSGF